MRIVYFFFLHFKICNNLQIKNKVLLSLAFFNVHSINHATAPPDVMQLPCYTPQSAQSDTAVTGVRVAL